MKFALRLAGGNLRRRPFRAAAMALLVLFLSFTVFTGAAVILSLRSGLSAYRARLGADIVVVPYVSSGSSSIEDILLTGASENHYMSGQKVDKIREIEGVEAVSTQFYLTSAKASCCSSAVQIIGFDPETDFVIQPWISESWSGTLADGEVIVGSEVNVPADRTVTFYGNDYYVAAQLAESGTGLDRAVYTNMTTIRRMAESASTLMKTGIFDGVSFKTSVSAVMVKVADGYDISYVTGRINVLVSKVEAIASKSMISDLSDGLEQVSGIIGGLIAAVWVLAVVILIAVFALISNERKKEFAVLRVMGASKKLLTRIMAAEAAILSGIGALGGILVSAAAIPLLSDALSDALSLPTQLPGIGVLALLAVGALLLAVLAGVLAALLSAGRMIKSETGLLLKEDA